MELLCLRIYEQIDDNTRQVLRIHAAVSQRLVPTSRSWIDEHPSDEIRRPKYEIELCANSHFDLLATNAFSVRVANASRR